jgi:glycine/sarcosine N-methyltransferase
VTFTGQKPDMADEYDRFVDWNKRLGREGPMYREIFSLHDVHSVADVGCGTAKHAILFASWGLEVTGIDPDPAMLAQAQANVDASPETVTLVQGGFGEVARLLPGPVDAVVCAGNALPHVDGLSGLRAAIADFAQVVRPGGIAVLHLLNHDRLIAGRVRTMQPVVRDDDGTWVYLRVMDYVEGGIRFDFVTMYRPAGGWESDAAWQVSSRRSLHTAIPSAVLVGELETAGFSEVRSYGNHTLKHFDPATDESLIVVAVRGA